MTDANADVSSHLNARGSQRSNRNRGRARRGKGPPRTNSQPTSSNEIHLQESGHPRNYSRGNGNHRRFTHQYINRDTNHHPVESTLVDEAEEDLPSAMNDLNLRESIISKLSSCNYSCLICLGTVMARDPVWSCDSCFHIFHLRCMTDWALSSKPLKAGAVNSLTDIPKGSWRCPACQKTHLPSLRPLLYRCFCGKASRPEYHPGHTTIPHGCDEICGKPKFKTPGTTEKSRSPPCPHTCTELCHPGPCPPCAVIVELACPCGRVVRRARCGDEPPEPCGAPCNRLHAVNGGRCAFGTHSCHLNCHDGDCAPCKKIIKSDEVVFCGGAKARRYNLTTTNDESFEGDLDSCDLEMFFDEDDDEKERLLAGVESIRAIFVGTVFSCEQVCDRPLACGHHKCPDACHPGDCRPCHLLPNQCITCPCGRVPLSKLVRSGDVHGDRRKCTDPVPECPNTCGRPNPICGHPCPTKCHAGPECPPCQLTTSITCRCGKSSKEATCQEYALSVMTNSKSIEFLCERICRKKKSCGRHKCKRQCCDMVVHACQEVCGRTLSCGKHTCEDICHCGPCGSCWRGVINEEVYCHCGATFLAPPQPCDTKPPDCPRPCGRQHSCDHPVTHNCHSDPECPKCTVLMTKRCPGDHTWMFNVPCFQTVVTCGRACDKPLPRCSHRCRRACHAGACLPTPLHESASGTLERECSQPCPRARPDCGHPCGLPCHDRNPETVLPGDVTAPASFCAKSLGKLRCKVPIELVCACGHRQEDLPCYQVKALASALEKKDPAMYLRARRKQESVSASGNDANNKNTHQLPFGLSSNEILPCDSSCSRTQAAAAATGAEDAPKTWSRGGVLDESLPSPFPPPEYSDTLKTFASNNLTFVQDVEKTLYDLVDQALAVTEGGSGSSDATKCFSHRFIPMKRHKRRFILELAEFYGMETVELDPEPHRHVQVFTNRLRARFPGGTRRHYTSLSGQIRDSFVGTIKIPPNTAVAPAAAANVRSAALRQQQQKLVSFSSVVGEPVKSPWDD